jgi:WW domain-binding protein 4
MGVPNQRYSISAQSAANWCALCKCFVQPSQKQTHERSQKHKDAIDRKMKDIANKTAKKKSEEDSLKRQIQDIENQAMHAFASKDIGGANASRPMGNHERARVQGEYQRKALEEEITVELRAKEELEFRMKHKYGDWVWDERTKYYWHGMSSTYFDPKSRMFFDNIAKKWSKNCPENAPSVPMPSVHQMASAQPVGVSSAAAKGQTKPIYSNHNNDNNSDNNDAYSAAQKVGAAAIAAAGLSQKVAPVGVMSQTAKKLKPTSVEEAFELKKKQNKMHINITTSNFNLGYGSNHPAYEAAKAKTNAGRKRAYEAAGGALYNAHSKDVKDASDTGGGAGAKKKKKATGVNAEEQKALDAREAARARLEARSKKAFGLM